ncbi:MAG: glycosyltransferase family 4 protein [Patescibacteria group bacterium]|nr:glycosyltransferase family 4 protein [Patescibacteria group bacterium]
MILSGIFWAYKNKISNKLWGVVHMPAKGKKKGDVLLSYITEPFTKAPWEEFSNRHTNYWECYEMACIFAERGYAVDVISWNNRTFVPKKNYRVCVDNQNNLERLARFLPKDCKKVMHITTSEQGFQNSAELKRLEALKEQRGVVLQPHRQLPPTKNPEIADYLEGFGNRTVHATYARFNKPIFPIPISAVKLFNFPEHKDFKVARKNFLWFGGGGAVLKGLDLVLEAFSKNPDLTLHVCGPVAAEKDFAQAYTKELYETPNIHYHGRVDVDSDLFAELADTCGALMYPAFSEGTSGAVVQAMHAGVVPILTREAGISEDAECILMENPTVDSVDEAARSFAALPPEIIRDKARAIRSYVREHYTRELFSNAYAAFIDMALNI